MRPGPGRPRRFCRPSCRQRDYEARRRAEALGLDERELIVTRAQLDELWDHLWVLECTVADVERDLADNPTLAEHQRALAWLLEVIRPLLALRPR